MSADKECTTYVVKYSYPVDCGGTAADNPQILPAVCIATGKFTITECNVNIPSPDFPPSGGGGGGAFSVEENELLALENGYRGKMTEEELKIYNKLELLQKLDYLRNADFAVKNANQKFPALSQHNDIADAYRRCLFSMLNVRTLGYELARALGDAHELAIRQPELERQMDLHNNSVGRGAHEYGISLTDKAMLMVNSGRLVYIKNGILSPTNQ